MEPLPTLPRRSWLERASFTLSVIVTLIGAATLLGWWLRVDEVLQPFVAQPAMKPNEALGFLLLGASVLLLALAPRRFPLLALAPALIGAVTLLQRMLGRDLHIDELLARDHIMLLTAYPGRMSELVATGLVLSGLSLAWRATPRWPLARLFAEAVSGSILAAAGLSTLLGYVAHLPAVHNWGSATATPPVAAVCLLLFGSVLIMLAWRESTKIQKGPPAWAPVPAVIGCLTLTVILWVGLSDRENFILRQRTQSSMTQLALQLGSTVDQQATEIERLARRWSENPDLWTPDAAELMAKSGPLGCVRIAFVDIAQRTRWIYPLAGNEAFIGYEHAGVEERREALESARKLDTGAPIISASVPILNPAAAKGMEKGAVVYAPVLRGSRITGYLAAEYVYETMFGRSIAALPANLGSDYHITITIGGQIVFRRGGDAPARTDDLTVNRTVNLANRLVHLSLTPSPRALADDRRLLPELALVAGFGISILLGITFHLARSARAGQRAAETSNKLLFTENEERRRVEARLKVSDERLRLALDSTQIGIFEWNVPTGHVYYSPGLWAMLGYEVSRMPPTAEAWQTLVHADDLPLYRRRTDSQLKGIATFIEPEYRVRANNGDWRWVYTRSKSVALDSDGRPTRIIGTVQDITARREAEIALRESQAEARKLSLVASKTDNPVLIGSADGRIEWANEAFCRVMEYSLEEVVGRNPAVFLVGPETRIRTVARIRRAMTEGVGISTDVVNYSKSGRKYHLHIEIQPVRGADGKVENFIAVETDITMRVETEAQLRRAKAEADGASRAKSEFLASMSHEIRTPMNGVIGMTSLLMETTLNGEQRDFVNTIRTSGEALLTIINDILDFSKIESGKMELERTPFELALCLEDALDLFALQASTKGLELTYHIESDVPAWIVGDVTRLRQIVVNLVNNAVKFTPGGSIALTVRRITREPPALGFVEALPENPARFFVEFVVHDTGIGIPADRLDRLFKAFSQVDSSTTRKYGGTGLGLVISQRLIDLMGGTIRVESTAGQGSSFIFTIQTERAPQTTEPGLPLAPAGLLAGTTLCVEDHPVTQARLRSFFEKWGAPCIIVPDAAAAVAAAAKLDRAPVLLVLDAGPGANAHAVGQLNSLGCPRLVLYPFGQTAPASPPEGPVCASTSKPLRNASFTHAIRSLFNPTMAAAVATAKAAERPISEEFPLEVLLAEDNAVNQKVALRFLQRLGYRADAVANGLEVLKALETRRYDLVLMDLQMPEMDGLEASRQIRARFPADRQPKIFALTANAMQGDRELCLTAGMDDYISKPVKISDISAAIRRQFGSTAGAAPPEQLIG